MPQMRAMGPFTWFVLLVTRTSSRSRTIVRNINDRFWSTDTISTNTPAHSMSTSGSEYIRMAAKAAFECTLSATAGNLSLQEQS